MRLLALSSFAFLLVGGCGSTPVSNNHPPADMSMMPSSVDGAVFFEQCDVMMQTGCQMGQHCSAVLYFGQPADRCVNDVANPIPEGGDCSPVLLDADTVGDACAPGTVCSAIGSSSKCRRVCFQHKDCPNNETCAGPTNSPATRSTMFGDIPLSACIASEGCDPVTEAGCPSGTRCLFSPTDDVTRALLCLKDSGAQAPDTICDSSLQCGAGEMCAGLGFCRIICYQQPLPDGTGACPPGEGSCMQFTGSGTQYGRCE